MAAQDFNAAFYALTVCGARARALGEFDVALEWAHRSLEVARQVGPLNIVDAHQELSAVFEQRHEFEQALEASRQALREYENAQANGIKETSGHWLLGARVQHSLSKILCHLGRDTEALEHVNIAVQQATERGVPRRELEFLLTRARVLTALNRITEARADYERILPMAQQLQVLEQEVQTRLEALPSN